MTDDPDPLTALSQLRQVRRELDRRERRLIEDSRARGASWADIAVALGLRSRQAAEQRWLRLCGEATRDPSRARVARQNQRAVDAGYGAPIARLRAAAQTAYRQIEDDSVWDQRHPRAVLIEMSLRSAVDAAPGALFDLVTQAEADLEQLSWRGLPAQLATALRDLRRAFTAAAEAR